MLNENELYTLLSAYKQGTIDPAGRLKLEMWACESEENRLLAGLLSGSSAESRQLRRLYSYDQERVWHNIRRSAQREGRRRLARRIARTAAAASLLLGAIWGTEHLYDSYQRRDALVSVIPAGRTMAVLELSSGAKVDLTDRGEQQLTEADRTRIAVNSESTVFSQPEEKSEPAARPLFNTVSVPKGGEYRLELCDGTKVWLNSESEITFPTQFADSVRSVALRGEAYFEVKSDAAHPFVVETDLLSVRVLGTSFNLTAYADDPAVEATLITGSLKVIHQQEETLLVPGMQARLDKQANTLTTQAVYAEGYAAWAHRMFVFFNEPVPSICRRLARWYDVEIDASAPELEQMLYSGMIERAETFNMIADLLSATDELVFREREGKIIVEKKNRK